VDAFPVQEKLTAIGGRIVDAALVVGDQDRELEGATAQRDARAANDKLANWIPLWWHGDLTVVLGCHCAIPLSFPGAPGVYATYSRTYVLCMAMVETRESARVRKMVAGGEGKRRVLGANDGHREQGAGVRALIYGMVYCREHG
jgi:hypothetical protein